MSEFNLPDEKEFLSINWGNDQHLPHLEKLVREYGVYCARAALEEIAVRMRNNADQTVAKWEEIGDDEDVIHAKSAAFSVYVHAASIRKFATEIA